MLNFIKFKDNADGRELFQDILKKCIEGSTEKSSSIIKSAMVSDKLKKLDIIRDPILNALAVSI